MKVTFYIVLEKRSRILLSLCEFYLDRISSTPYQYFSGNMNLKELLMSFSSIIHDLKRKTMPLAPTHNEFG